MCWGIAHSHQCKYEMFKVHIFHLVPAPGPQPGPVWQPDGQHKGVPLMKMFGSGSWHSPWLTALPARSWAQVCARHPAGAVPRWAIPGNARGQLGAHFLLHWNSQSCSRASHGSDFKRENESRAPSSWRWSRAGVWVWDAQCEHCPCPKVPHKQINVASALNQINTQK